MLKRLIVIGLAVSALVVAAYGPQVTSTSCSPNTILAPTCAAARQLSLRKPMEAAHE